MKQEKKKLNKELSKVMNKMNLTFIASNNKLRGIARGGESRNSLQDIMSYKLESEGRRGRSISNQKLLFKNKTGLSDITMAKIKLEEFNDVVDMERMEDRLRFSRGWVHATPRRCWTTRCASATRWRVCRGSDRTPYAWWTTWRGFR
jgi:hypothetical protein